MPPKKKVTDKQAKKVVEDKTFGMKNKKGAKAQKFIQDVEKQVGRRVIVVSAGGARVLFRAKETLDFCERLRKIAQFHVKRCVSARKSKASASGVPTLKIRFDLFLFQ